MAFSHAMASEGMPVAHAMASQRMPSDRPGEQARVACRKPGRCQVARLGVTVVDCPATLHQFSLALAGHQLIALEVHGVNLPPRLEISLIQIATPSECFLLDVKGKPMNAPVVALARAVLQDGSVCKIVQDCRAASEGLFHLLGITLKHVHDTQAWDTKLLVRHIFPSHVVRRDGRGGIREFQTALPALRAAALQRTSQ
ncbi:hypothetical protein T484DRAFT_1886175, partial [Baffinella frigidus]